MDWDEDLPTWPLSGLSRRVASRPHVWHVQETGSGPLVLLVHGAGSSTHTWREVIPDLARDFRVVAVDLPGQGFSSMGTRLRCGLQHVAEDLAALCAQENWAPALIVGHSAGAAIALRLGMVLHRAGVPEPVVVGVNAALAPFDGIVGWLFPAVAKVLNLNPFVPSFVAMTSGTPARVRQLLESTGSRVRDDDVALYAQLIGDPRHLDGTLAMMANWDLDGLARDLPLIDLPVRLIAANGDCAVAPAVSEHAATVLPRAELVRMDGLGHLAQEEAPARVARLIREALRTP